MRDAEAEYDLEGVKRSPLPWVIAVLIAASSAIGCFVEMERAKDASVSAAAAARESEAAIVKARSLEQENRALEESVTRLERERGALIALATKAPSPPEKHKPMKKKFRSKARRANGH
jgi:hypothetical protein